MALPIFPGRRQPSIVSRNELNYRVRNGNGWTLTLINTNYVFRSCRRTFCIIPFSSRFVKKDFGDPYRIRTDVNGVRGRCLNHLTNGPWCTFSDSNRGPTDEESVALPTELKVQVFLLSCALFAAPSKPNNVTSASCSQAACINRRSSPRAISTSQLHTLLRFHTLPINQVVFLGPYSMKDERSHLRGSFTLRCFQRLSRPYIATQLCPWQDNWCTRGTSIPVLSY